MRKITKPSKRPSLLTMMLNRPSSGSWCCDWPACCGGCGGLRQWETGLFEIQADYLHELRQGRQTQPKPQEIIYARFERADTVDADPDRASHGMTNGTEVRPSFGPKFVNSATGPRTLLFAPGQFAQLPARPAWPVRKQSFGARPAGSCLLLRRWIVANHKKEGAVSVWVAGKTGPPMDATIANAIAEP